jgi:hypothetical protein
MADVMRRLLDGVLERVGGKRLGSGGREFLLDKVVDGRLAQTTGEPVPHLLAQALAGDVLLSHAADGGSPRGHLHDAAGALPERPFPFQVPVGPRHRLRIRQQLLGTGAVLRQLGAGLEGPRGNVGPDLTGDLLMNRHRGIVLNVDHDAVDTTAGRRAIQPFVVGDVAELSSLLV